MCQSGMITPFDGPSSHNLKGNASSKGKAAMAAAGRVEGAVDRQRTSPSLELYKHGASIKVYATGGNHIARYRL